ncbi:EamA family transporter [Paenibacillus sp. NRS-1782]|uniref:EamA family transporter n=1 Tax=unclassified Paenibacillus TaxID=185978 RepID=UPI003D2ADAAA
MGIIFILFSALFTAVGQALWKVSDTNNMYILALGLILYVCGAALMVIAFKFGDLSVLHPLLSFGYIFAILIGNFFLKEQVGFKEIIGIILIVLGAVLISVERK